MKLPPRRPRLCPPGGLRRSKRYEKGHCPDAHAPAGTPEPGHAPDSHGTLADEPWAEKDETSRLTLPELHCGQITLVLDEATSFSNSPSHLLHSYS